MHIHFHILWIVINSQIKLFQKKSQSLTYNMQFLYFHIDKILVNKNMSIFMMIIKINIPYFPKQL